MYDSKAKIIPKVIKKSFTYNNTEVLKVNLKYINIYLKNELACRKINMYFNNYINNLYNYISTSTLDDAVSGYKFATANNYPFFPYEVDLDYKITMNSNYILSMYFDKYEFTGGAHGNTIRFGTTWDLKNGNLLTLSEIFPNVNNLNEQLISQIILQANYNMKKNPGIYFNNYKDLIKTNFNEANFYLTPNSVNIFYQQYDIAPYSTGIVVFSIPFNALKV